MDVNLSPVDVNVRLMDLNIRLMNVTFRLLNVTFTLMSVTLTLIDLPLRLMDVTLRLIGRDAEADRGGGQVDRREFQVNGRVRDVLKSEDPHHRQRPRRLLPERLPVETVRPELMVGAVVMVLIETGLAKLRIFRLPDYLGSAFLLATLGMIAFFILE